MFGDINGKSEDILFQLPDFEGEEGSWSILLSIPGVRAEENQSWLKLAGPSRSLPKRLSCGGDWGQGVNDGSEEVLVILERIMRFDNCVSDGPFSSSSIPQKEKS